MNVEKLREVVEKKIADNKDKINKFNEDMTKEEMLDTVRTIGFSDGVEWVLEVFTRYADD